MTIPHVWRRGAEPRPDIVTETDAEHALAGVLRELTRLRKERSRHEERIAEKDAEIARLTAKVERQRAALERAAAKVDALRTALADRRSA